MKTVRPILHTPVARIIIGFVFCLALNIILQNILSKGLDYTSLSHPVRIVIKSIILSILFVAGYIRFYTWYEKRSVTEYLTGGITRYIFTGLLLGSLLQALTIFIIYLNNGFHIISINPWTRVL